MTGRGAGYCEGYGAPGYANPIPGGGTAWVGDGAGPGVAGGEAASGAAGSMRQAMSIFARDWATGFRLSWATRRDDAAYETPVGG
ncbi:MAG: hypothetical protein PVH41_16515 [Anaerolineae bacterium]